MPGLSSKIIGASAAVVTLFIMVSLAQEMNRRLQIQNEVRQLEEEVQSAQKKVVELENLNQYFETDAYQERLAREKLNYKAPGEQVVVISQQGDAPEAKTDAKSDDNQYSVPEKWWRLFFGPDKTKNTP